VPDDDALQGREPDAELGASGRPRGRLGLFALAFWSGFAVLAIEIAGARMIAPVFGLSAIPWTAVIGVVLAALAVGSHLGGRWADEGRIPLSAILLVAAVTGVLPVLGTPVPWLARDLLGFIPGAVVSALVLFAPPVLCLGAVVPYLVAADARGLDSVGRSAGDLSAAATAGSILGSFVTGFVLLPLMPLPVLMAVTAGSLFVMAALAGRLLGGVVPPSAALAGALAIGSLAAVAEPRDPSVIHRAETMYGSVQVTERPWQDGRLVRELWQNGASSSAEYVDDGAPAHPYVLASLDLLAPRLHPGASVLVLGGAALTLPVGIVDRHPGVGIDVVEIDPAVTDLARRYFAAGGLPDTSLRVVHDDARVWLRGEGDGAGAAGAGYDVVYLDVFDHLLTVPWTMVTREAFQAMAGRMAPGGLLVANVLSPLDGPGAAFLHRLRSTLESVFPQTRIFLVEPGADPRVTQNLLVVAASPSGTLPDGPGRVARVPAVGRPFTDRWAPVEQLQARVFLQGLGWQRD